MSPVDSRKRNPKDWRAYDHARGLAFALKTGGLVVLTRVPEPGKETPLSTHATDQVVELLDLLCTLLRERIEAEASGKAASR